MHQRGRERVACTNRVSDSDSESRVTMLPFLAHQQAAAAAASHTDQPQTVFPQEAPRLERRFRSYRPDCRFRFARVRAAN